MCRLNCKINQYSHNENIKCIILFYIGGSNEIRRRAILISNNHITILSNNLVINGLLKRKRVLNRDLQSKIVKNIRCIGNWKVPLTL